MQIRWEREGRGGVRGSQRRAWRHRHHLSVSRTSHRIWVAFFALKSSGVSSSTVSPLPFTPSSRSFLYSFYAMEERQERLQRRPHRQARPRHTDNQGSKSPKSQQQLKEKTTVALILLQRETLSVEMLLSLARILEIDKMKHILQDKT